MYLLSLMELSKRVFENEIFIESVTIILCVYISKTIFLIKNSSKRKLTHIRRRRLDSNSKARR